MSYEDSEHDPKRTDEAYEARKFMRERMMERDCKRAEIYATAIHRARNDPMYANLVHMLRNLILDSGISELDIVAAARLAAEDVDRVRRDEYWRKWQHKSVVIPVRDTQRTKP